MEREGCIKRINELLDSVQILVDVNVAMGKRLEKMERMSKEYEALRAENEKLKGELAMRKRGRNSRSNEKLVAPPRQIRPKTRMPFPTTTQVQAMEFRKNGLDAYHSSFPIFHCSYPIPCTFNKNEN